VVLGAGGGRGRPDGDGELELPDNGGPPPVIRIYQNN
jgi:hypothetical protein